MPKFRRTKFSNKWYAVTLTDGRECAIKHNGILGNNYDVLYYSLDDKQPVIKECKAELLYDETTSSLTIHNREGIINVTEEIKPELAVLENMNIAISSIEENLELKKQEREREIQKRLEEQERKEREERERKEREAEQARKEAEERAKREQEYKEKVRAREYNETSKDLFVYKISTSGERISYTQPNQLQQSLGYTSVPTRNYSSNSHTVKGDLDFIIDILNYCVESSEAISKIPFDEKEALVPLQSKVRSVCPPKRNSWDVGSLTQEEFDQKMQESQTFSSDLESVFVSFCQYAKTNNIPLEELSYRETNTYERYDDTIETTYMVPDTFKTLCKGIGKYISNTLGIEDCKQFAEKIGDICGITPTDIITNESKITEIDD